MGYYGNNPEKNFTERNGKGNDFLARVCYEWEAEINKIAQKGIRTVNIRTGVVLSNKGGAFPHIMKPIKIGLGAVLGKGNQFIPWIHIDDLTDIYAEAIINPAWNGPINAVAPEHLTNKMLTIGAANYMNKKIRLPNIPSFILKLILGELSTLVLKGSRVSSTKLKALSFTFKFQNINQVFKDLLHHNKVLIKIYEPILLVHFNLTVNT